MNGGKDTNALINHSRLRINILIGDLYCDGSCLESKLYFTPVGIYITDNHDIILPPGS